MIDALAQRPTLCVVGHTTYGLLMVDELWHASCGCGWRSAPSPDLAEQTDELDAHLRVVVDAGQRPGRVSRTASAGVLQLVDHTLVLGGLVVGLVLAAPVLGRRT